MCMIPVFELYFIYQHGSVCIIYQLISDPDNYQLPLGLANCSTGKALNWHHRSQGLSLYSGISCHYFMYVALKTVKITPIRFNLQFKYIIFINYKYIGLSLPNCNYKYIGLYIVVLI